MSDAAFSEIWASLNSAEKKADDTKHRDRIRSHATKYVDLCNQLGIVAFPASYRSIGVYVCKFVASMNGSAKSVDNIISYLRVFCHYLAVPWMTDSDRYRLNVVVRRLKLEDLWGHKQARPITNDLLLQMLETITLGDQQEFMTMMLMFMAHDGLFRSCELFAGMRAGDVEWCDSDRSFVLTVWRSKASRSGPPEYVRVGDHHGPSAYKFLRLWYQVHGLFDNHTSYILPRVVWTARRGQGNAYQLDWTQEATIGWWDTVIKLRTEKIGLDSTKYTGHSFRPGGATDLFAMGVSYPVVQKMGRWLSNAPIQYMRDMMMVAQTVAAAFGEMARRNQNGMGVWTVPRGDFHL